MILKGVRGLNLEKLKSEMAERKLNDDEFAMQSACGEYNCPCHYDLPGAVAEIERLTAAAGDVSGACDYDHDALTRVWAALGIDSYTGKSVDEHVAELRQRAERAEAEVGLRQVRVDYFTTLAASRLDLLVAAAARVKELEAERKGGFFLGPVDESRVLRAYDDDAQPTSEKGE